jgi:hypothetical protein
MRTDSYTAKAHTIASLLNQNTVHGSARQNTTVLPDYVAAVQHVLARNDTQTVDSSISILQARLVALRLVLLSEMKPRPNSVSRSWPRAFRATFDEKAEN